jgi:hypothetical protein
MKIIGYLPGILFGLLFFYGLLRAIHRYYLEWKYNLFEEYWKIGYMFEPIVFLIWGIKWLLLKDKRLEINEKVVISIRYIMKGR